MSLFPIIAYPLDVIKTNRIVGVQQAASVEASESLSRDLVKVFN